MLEGIKDGLSSSLTRKDSAPHSPVGILMGDPHLDRFFRTHEKVMWQMSALDFGRLQPDLLDPVEIEVVQGAMLVESHNPVYTMRILEYYRSDHVMTTFTTTWAYEEMKHY